MNNKINPWIEAMRLRTLPVSVAGVLTGGSVALANHGFRIVPFLICMLFAMMAQIVSNFANEYFDYKNGLDKKGREGFRRGVTEGDISPRAMRNATFGLLGATCLVGCTLIHFGGWILIPVGMIIAIGALAYSAGPYPLSHHGLGDIAVYLFYGLIPVFFTAYVQIPDFQIWPLAVILGNMIGFMGINVLIINNYRDFDDDKTVGKRTTAVIFGKNILLWIYLANGFIATLLMVIATISFAGIIWQVGALAYVNIHYLIWQQMRASEGKELNSVLGKTARLMFFISLWIFVFFLINT